MDPQGRGAASGWEYVKGLAAAGAQGELVLMWPGGWWYIGGYLGRTVHVFEVCEAPGRRRRPG